MIRVGPVAAGRRLARVRVNQQAKTRMSMPQRQIIDQVSTVSRLGGMSQTFCLLA